MVHGHLIQRAPVVARTQPRLSRQGATPHGSRCPQEVVMRQVVVFRQQPELLKRPPYTYEQQAVYMGRSRGGGGDVAGEGRGSEESTVWEHPKGSGSLGRGPREGGDSAPPHACHPVRLHWSLRPKAGPASWSGFIGLQLCTARGAPAVILGMRIGMLQASLSVLWGNIGRHVCKPIRLCWLA